MNKRIKNWLVIGGLLATYNFGGDLIRYWAEKEYEYKEYLIGRDDCGDMFYRMTLPDTSSPELRKLKEKIDSFFTDSVYLKIDNIKGIQEQIQRENNIPTKEGQDVVP